MISDKEMIVAVVMVVVVDAIDDDCLWW